jgi:hypothetical protein
MTMLAKLTNLILVTLLAAAGLPGGGGNEFRWKKGVAQGQTVEVKGVNGAIRALAAQTGEVEVLARKHGRRSDPAAVEVKVVEHAGGVTVCAVYPNPGGAANECQPGEGGRMQTRDNDVEVDFEVRVPAGVRFVGRSVNGAVEAEGLEGDAEAVTVNGGIKLATRGAARAETVNGSIQASLGRADWKGEAVFKTVNGSVRVELPAQASAEVRAKTVNGDVSNDFGLPVQGRFVGRHLDGTLGSGGRQLRLETVNGSIRLLKAGS